MQRALPRLVHGRRMMLLQLHVRSLAKYFAKSYGLMIGLIFGLMIGLIRADFRTN